MPSQLHNSPSPPPTSSPPVRKTRVPALNRKKSAVALGTGAKRKAPNFYTLLHSEDFSMRIDGIHQLAKKLSAYPYSTQPELEQIQLETTPTTHVDGETLKGIVLQQFEDPFHFLIYETLSSWECVTCVMLRLLTFEEYIPRLILDAYIDEPARRNEVDLVRYKEGKLALKRAKLFLQHEHPGLVDLIFTSLLQFGGFGAATPRIQTLGARKDIFKLPANRRKLTKEFIVWMDELVVPMIGLEEPIDLADPSYEGIPDQYIHSDHSTATRWFESDINIRHCLDILLPLVTAHSSGSLWHGPLITFMKHLRLLNQRLFDSITAGYDENTMNKICRVLGIHIRIEPAMVAPPVEQEEEQLQIEKKLDSVDQVAETKDELPAAFVPIPEIVTPKEQEQIVPEQQEEYTLIQEEKKDQPSFVDTYDEPLEQPSEEQQEYEPPKEVQPVYAEKPAVMDAYSPSEEEQQKTPELPDVVYNSKSHKVEPKAPDLAEVMYDKRLEEEEQSRLKSPIPDYFQSSMIPPLASNFSPNTVMENGFYANGDAGGILYTNHASTERSTPVAEMSASPQQQPLEQPPGVGQLQPSEPNKEKYPEPQFVPFFHPEKVSYSCPVFESNTRSTTTVSVRGGKDKTVLLYALIDKLKSLSNNMSDNINTFRKLTRLLKEVPIRRRWDQGGNEETGNETWAGGNGDGGNFVELVQSILLHLEQPPSRCMTSALECIRQLAMTQSGLFKFYERKSNSKGMTLESQLMEKLLELRSDENPTICIAAEDALDAVLSTLTPPTAFEMLMAFVVYRSVIAPYDEHSISGSRYHPVGTAFTYIAKWVKELNDVFYIEEWMAKGAVNAFFKGMNSSLVNIRKSCVEAIVALHEVVNDDIYLYLVDLREDQSNLIRHYVAKSLKKKASLRSIREAHQYL
ncbi:hypothetical protein RMATCC62417_09001 [Rhizopus microsporus]|nr:hypothetical protein RMATCC62417_09001 [Rhizopus microsporus]